MILAEVKAHMGRLVETRICDKFIPYRLTACIMRQNQETGEFYYDVELRDLNAHHSVVIRHLDEIRPHVPEGAEIQI